MLQHPGVHVGRSGHHACIAQVLGDLVQATRLHEAVLDDTARSPRDQAYYRALLAGNLVAAGDPEQAISHGLMILPTLGSPLISVRVLRELRPVRKAAGATAAAEFCERFDAAARALRPV